MTRIGISFKETEKELLEYLKTKRSISSYIKDLIEADKDKTVKKEVKQQVEEEKGEFEW